MSEDGQISWLNTDQVAARLGLKNRSTLDDWARQGKGPRFYRIGRTRRYDAADVDAYLKSCRVDTIPEHSYYGAG